MRQTKSELFTCFRIGVPLVLSCLVAGCFRPEPIRREQLERGLIVLLPGVECTMQSMSGIYHGLRDAGVDRAIEIIQWGDQPFGTFRNLQNLPRNRKRAQAVADRITRYNKEYPKRPVALIGYSGGGGIAIFVAEVLPNDMQLDLIVLLGPALSPGYDLTTALTRSSRGVVHFYSNQDWYQLGFGTSLLGTIDRKYTSSAGKVGFHDDKNRLLESDGIEQIAWRPAWWKLGHGGNHWGWLSRQWARQILAPKIDPSLASKEQKVQSNRGDS